MIEFIISEPALTVGIAAIIGFILYSAFRDSAVKAELAASTEPDKRIPIFNSTMIWLWSLAALVTAAWLVSGRSLFALGFQSEPSTGFWIGWALTIIAGLYYGFQVLLMMRSAKARQGFRDQIASVPGVDLVHPSSRREHASFQLVSVTAGITEEIAFRGFLIGAFAIVMPVWVAAIAAIAATLLFAIGHFYQGISGMIRVALIGSGFALIFVLTNSLWPVILLHFLVDSLTGAMFAIAQAHDDDSSDTPLPQPAA